MKKVIFSMILILSVIMAGCGSEKETGEEEQVFSAYYLNDSYTKVVSEKYKPKATDAQSLLKEMAELQDVEPENEKVHSLLPEGVHIESYELNSGILTLDLNDEYKDMETTREILTRLGLVRTFGQIPEVKRVKLSINGDALTDSAGNKIGSLSENDFIENAGKDINSYKNITITLYFTDATGKVLHPEERNIYYSSNVPLEKEIIKQLAAGPKDSNLLATIPSDTTVLNSAISENVCYINFDDKINMPMLGVDEDITIHSIVNSLISAVKVSEVQMSINGDSKMDFRDKIDLDQFFAWDASYIKKGDS